MKEEFYAEYYEIENVHWWFLARWHIFLNLIRNELGHREGSVRALDVGCGTGTMLGHLESFGSAYGLDIATEALQFCKSRGRDRLTQGMTTALPFEDGTFDLVTALDILEHVGDDSGALEELGRVLRPRGCILITVPAYHFLWGQQDEIALHLRRYTAGELRTKIEAAGLVIKKLTYFNTLLFPVIAGVRLGRRLLPRSNNRELVSDFTMTRPGRANDLLARIFSLESGLVNRVALPFGVSILAIASEPDGIGS